MRARIFGIIGFIATILLAFSIGAPHIRPNDRDILSLFGLIFPYLYLFGLFTLPFLWSKNKVTFALLMLLILGSTRDFFSYVKMGSSVAAASEDIHIVSFNAMMGTRLVDSKHVLSPARLDRFDSLMHQSPKPDIICAQEVNFVAEEAFRKSFKDYPFYHEIEKRGAVIISRFPFIKTGEINFGGSINSCLWADINLGSDTIRMYSVHLESNRLSESSYEFLAKEEYEGKEAIDGIRDLIVKYPKYAALRGQQARQVRSHIEKSPYPVVLAGDFNDPPMSYTYQVLRDGMSDTYMERGHGWGTTWIGTIPMLRIDYILTSPSIKTVSFTCMETDMSDHYPIKASIRL